LLFGLISDGLIMLDSVASNGSFEGNDFEGIRKEAVLDEVEDVSVRLLLETKEYHETFQDNVCLCSGFEPETSSSF
jgi:hypothetical protein